MALSLGNSVHGNQAGNTVVSLTLSYSVGSIIIVDTTCNGSPIVSVVSTALGNFTHHATQPLGGFERWFLIPSSSQTNDTITVTQTSSAFFTADAYEVKGGDTVSPFDSGGPVTSNGPDPVSITTVNANTMVIAGFREASTASPTAGATFTQISGADFQLTEYKILSSAQTLSCTQTTGATDSNGLILDAIKQAPASAGIRLIPTPPKLQRPYRQGPLAGLHPVRAFPVSTAVTVSMSGLTAVQFKAAAASTSQLAAAARSEIQIKARAAATGATAVTAHAETMVKAAGGLAGATAMTGRTAVQIKSAATPTMAAAIAGRATAMLKAASAATGVVPLAGLATTMVKAAGGITTGSFVALAARAAVMVKASAAATSQAALSARATTMTKASAAATGATAMAGQAAIMVKAAGAVSTGALVALTGMCTVMVKAAAQQAQATVIAAHLTLQVKAQSPAPVQPAAGQFQLITSMAGFFNPGSSAIP